MENLHDYSNYVTAAYVSAGVVLLGLALFVAMKYFATKSKVKNEKSA